MSELVGPRVRSVVRLVVAQFVIVAAAALLYSQSPTADKVPADADTGTPLHKAAQTGDLVSLQSQLKRGADPNLRDGEGRTPLMYAAAAGQLAAERALLAAGANVNAHSRAGRTALLETAVNGRIKSARLLLAAGADVNAISRGFGSALEAAERSGHNDIAAMLRRAGARTSGRSPGDKVCVRPWGGNGYCGTVEAVHKTAFRIRVTDIVGCEDGCPARKECSDGRPVGGASGIAVGDEVNTVSWCLTDTGVKK